VNCEPTVGAVNLAILLPFVLLILNFTIRVRQNQVCFEFLVGFLGFSKVSSFVDFSASQKYNGSDKQQT
jgi:hypothetical protein